MRGKASDYLKAFPGSALGPAANLDMGNPISSPKPAALLGASVEAFEVLLPVRVYAAGNAREAHWSSRHKRVKEQRRQLRESLESLGLANVVLWLPVTVTLTRVGGRKLDTDNLAYSLKGARDEWACFIHADDGDESKVKWRYEQRPGQMYGLRVKIERREG